MNPIILPLTATPPTRKNPKLLTLYGQQKVGKTTLLSQLDQLGPYLILETDPEGAEYLTCNRLQIESYDHFMSVCDAIILQKRPYKFIALDTATTFEEMCEIDATKRYKESAQGKEFKGVSVLELLAKGKDGEGFATGYRWLRDSFYIAMQKLCQCSPHIIVVAHLKDKYLKVEATDKGKDNNKVSAREIDLAGKCRAMLATRSCALGFLYRQSNTDGNKQTVYVSFETNEHVNSGTRATHLVQKVMPFDWKQIYID